MIKNVISIKNISFSYDKKPIYQGFSAEIASNNILFIMGVNGCGKTTLLRIICSFLKISSGEIEIDGKPIREYDSKSLSRVISYVPQVIKMNSDFLVKDYLVMGRTPYKSICSSITQDDYSLVEKYATQLGIATLLESDFNTLSGGQKQIVSICRALIQETPVIIMDEPMSALDLGKQADFLSLLVSLKEQGKTIILTSHNPNHALAISENCNVCLIHEKQLIGFGYCRDVLTEQNISKVYGNKVHLDTNGKNVNFDI